MRIHSQLIGERILKIGGEITELLVFELIALIFWLCPIISYECIIKNQLNITTQL